MSFAKPIWIVLLVPFGGMGVVSAQTATDSIRTLPQVEKVSSNVVHRVKINYSVAPSKNLNDLLREQTGIYIRNYGAGQLASISFRGTSAAQTDVLWNGVKLNSPSLGQVDASLFSLGMYDQIQITGTSQTGNVGGSLNLNNSELIDSAISLEAQITYGSFNTLRTFGKAGFGNGKLFGATRISYMQSDNDYTYISKPGSPKEKLTNAKVQLLHFMQQFNAEIDEHNMLHFNLWLSEAERQIPAIIGGGASKETQDDYSIRTSLAWKGKFRKLSAGFTSAFLHDVIHYKNPKIFVDEQSTEDGKSIMQALRNNFSFSYDSLKKFSVQVELSYDLERAIVPTYEVIRLRHIGRVSAGIKYEPVKEILLQLKVRESMYDKMFSPFSPAFTFRYCKTFKQKHYLILSANAARNFRFPTLNDLYWGNVGNPNLQTEKSCDGEIASSYSCNYWLTIKANGFCKYISNYIQWVSTGTDWEPRNVKTVLTRGAEISISAQTPANRDYNFRFSLNYAYTRATNLTTASSFDQSKGKQLIYVPQHLANATVYAEYKNFYLRAVSTVTDAVFITTDNSLDLKGYYLLDLELGKSFEIKSDYEIGLAFRVNNVTDKQYQNVAQRPMPGRNFEGTVRFNFRK